VVDRGAEFQSVYFSGLMAHCGIELILRPSGHGRFGAEVERSFGQYKEFWLASRPGNFVRLRNDRAVSRDFKSYARAELTFEQAAKELASYVDWFIERCPETAAFSPQAKL
jgi:putative transposase